MRKTYIDNIRWITVVLVVVYHVIYMFNGVETAGIIGPFSPVQYQDAFQYVVYPWFMVLLFVVSGMCARFQLDHTGTRSFLRSRTVKLLVPSTIGLLVFGWVLGYYNMQIAGALRQMGAVPKPVLFLIMAVSGTGPLWYIQLLWVFSLALVLLKKLLRGRLLALGEKAGPLFLLALTPVMWGAAQVLNTPIITVYRFGIYGAAFAAGYLLFSHEGVMERLTKWRIPLTIMAAGLGVAFLLVYWGQPYAEQVVLCTLLCNAYAWVAVLAILAMMYRYGNFHNGFTRWMAAKSWGLYLNHYLPLAMCAWYLKQYVPGLPPLVMYLACGIASFAGGYALYGLLSRIPLVRWCVCGISKRSK